MYHHDAADILYFKWYPSWNDRLCAYERCVRQFQEDHSGDVHTGSIVYTEIHIHLDEDIDNRNLSHISIIPVM